MVLIDCLPMIRSLITRDIKLSKNPLPFGIDCIIHHPYFLSNRQNSKMHKGRTEKDMREFLYPQKSYEEENYPNFEQENL